MMLREQKRDSLRLVLREIDVGDDEEEPGEGVLLAGVAVRILARCKASDLLF